MAFSAPTSEGYRDDPGARVHDLDDKTHMLAVDFPVCVDSYGTDFGPSCFEAGWRRQLPVLCENHRQDRVIGRAVRAESLPEAHRIVGRFSDFDAVPAARAAFANIRDGIFPGFSFHYVDGRTVPHPNGTRGALRYTRARMVEYGPVVAPSIPGTRVVGLRSSQDARGDLLAQLDGLASRAFDLVTDEQKISARRYEEIFGAHDARRASRPRALANRI
jgi:hypothetical protein